MAREERRLRRVGGGVVLATAFLLSIGASGCEPGPQVSVTPDKNLADAARVTVSGTGFSPNSRAFVHQCADVGGVEKCGVLLGADRQVDANGRVASGAVTVVASFSSGGVTVQCRTGCRVRIRDLKGVVGSHPISFQRYGT